MSPRRKKLLRRSLWIFALLLVLMNVVAALHAWRFTHFTDSKEARPEGASQYSFGQKLKMAFAGVPNPRPVNAALPQRRYSHLKIRSDVELDCWFLGAEAAAKGTVIMFHGYGGDKSSLLERAEVFSNAGYHVLLPDFRGSGGSEGAETTIGFREAADVAACCRFVRDGGEKNILLFGVSMGAAAILKHIHDSGFQPAGIILECPYATLYRAVCARFRAVNFPAFPMASLLTFWGGVEMGFNAFSLEPQEYAESVKCPALLIWGAKDDRVTRSETDDVFAALGGPKTLRIYPESGHANYLKASRNAWITDVRAFLQSIGHPAPFH